MIPGSAKEDQEVKSEIGRDPREVERKFEHNDRRTYCRSREGTDFSTVKITDFSQDSNDVMMRPKGILNS